MRDLLCNMKMNLLTVKKWLAHNTGKVITIVLALKIISMLLITRYLLY